MVIVFTWGPDGLFQSKLRLGGFHEKNSAVQKLLYISTVL